MEVMVDEWNQRVYAHPFHGGHLRTPPYETAKKAQHDEKKRAITVPLRGGCAQHRPYGKLIHRPDASFLSMTRIK